MRASLLESSLETAKLCCHLDFSRRLSVLDLSLSSAVSASPAVSHLMRHGVVCHSSKSSNTHPFITHHIGSPICHPLTFEGFHHRMCLWHSPLVKLVSHGVYQLSNRTSVPVGCRYPSQSRSKQVPVFADSNHQTLFRANTHTSRRSLRTHARTHALRAVAPRQPVRLPPPYCFVNFLYRLAVQV